MNNTILYITYLIVGIFGILFNTVPSILDGIGEIFMVAGIIIWPYLGYVVIMSLIRYRERPLFILAMATIVELILQFANTAFNHDNSIVYYSLAYLYFVGITIAPVYKLLSQKLR